LTFVTYKNQNGMRALNLFIFVCSGLQRPKCISSHPVDIDVFFTHQTIEGMH